MRVLGSYKNGNYSVTILSDGTKIRKTDDDEFIAAFPESFDCKICNRCDMGCPQCHEKSTCNGALGNLNVNFIDSLRPFTEIALGGGNVFEQPDLADFLIKLKSKKVIPSMTVNQVHFLKNKDFIKELVDNELIYGLGISLMDPSPDFIQAAKEFPNAVIHIIGGIFSEADYNALKNNDLKILILGYKDFGRGTNYLADNSDKISNNQKWLRENIKEVLENFKVVSFDNLAIKQLGDSLKSLLSEEEWDEFYMGDDGQHTMYVDLVKGEFAKSSTSTKRYPLMDTIDQMFEIIKNE